MNNDLLAEEWGKQQTPPISRFRVYALYHQGRLGAAYERAGRIWIPKGTPDPRRPHGGAGHLRTIRLRRLEEARARREAEKLEAGA